MVTQAENKHVNLLLIKSDNIIEVYYRSGMTGSNPDPYDARRHVV
jgi:hypothetical protein